MGAEPPSNGEYLIAAYAVTTALLLGYWLRLWRMVRRMVNGRQHTKR